MAEACVGTGLMSRTSCITASFLELQRRWRTVLSLPQTPAPVPLPASRPSLPRPQAPSGPAGPAPAPRCASRRWWGCCWARGSARGASCACTRRTEMVRAAIGGTGCGHVRARGRHGDQRRQGPSAHASANPTYVPRFQPRPPRRFCRAVTNAVAISVSLFLIVMTSVVLGTGLPFALAKAGVDPANAGTSIQVGEGPGGGLSQRALGGAVWGAAPPSERRLQPPQLLARPGLHMHAMRCRLVDLMLAWGRPGAPWSRALAVPNTPTVIMATIAITICASAPTLRPRPCCCPQVLMDILGVAITCVTCNLVLVQLAQGVAGAAAGTG